MKPGAVVALLCFSLVLSIVSARLLRLAARTRRLPELLLGLSMAFPLAGYTFGFLVASANQGVPPRWAAEVAGTLVDFGFGATVGFVWQVFRKDVRWAAVLCSLLGVGFLVMPFVNHLVPWANGVPSALVPRGVLRTICYGWAAMESLHYGILMRRRVFFGLAEPLLADRFRLWGWTHVCFSVMLVLIMLGAKLRFRGDDFARTCTLAGFLLGTIATIPLMLSFFPPDRYARYVERRYAREVTA